MMGKFDERIAFCPMCSVKISKVSGCNHMTCLFCKYEFCWVCGGESTSDHFNVLNPFNCGATQFMEKPPNRVLLLLLKVIGMSLVTMLLPMVLLFGLPIASACLGVNFVFICLNKVRRNIILSLLIVPVAILLPLMCFCLGMGLNIIFIPLALLAMGVSSWIYLGILSLK